MKEKFDLEDFESKFSSLKKEISDNGFSHKVMQNLPVERTPLWQYAIYAAAFVLAIVLINSFEISFSLTEFLKDFTTYSTNSLNAFQNIFTNIYFYIISCAAVMLFALRYIRSIAFS